MKKLFFLLVSLSGILCISAYDQIIHHLWVDNSPSTITYNGNNLSAQIDMSSLDDGLHVLGHVAILSDSTLTPPVFSYFLKYGSLSAGNKIDCYAIIDNDISKKYEVTCDNGIIHLDMDMSEISDGFHQISVQLLPKGSTTVISSVTSCFIKTAMIGDGQNIDCYAIVDNNSSKRYKCIPYSGGLIHVDMDMSDISEGLHQLTVYLNPEGSSTILSPNTSYFIKLPNGGSRITRYCYWFNNDIDNKRTIDIENPVTPYNIMGLLDADINPLLTSSYEFSMDGDDVIMTALHNFNLWSMDNTGRFSQTITQSYSDSRTQRRILSKDIEQLGSCHQKPVGTIRDNEIKWYRFDGEIGDSLAMGLTKSAMYELYSPSGKKVLAKKGVTAQEVSTTTFMETGVYHLALHDIASTYKNDLKLNFNHIPRNTILSVTPSVISHKTSGILFDIFGNGMTEITEVKIENKMGACYDLQIISLFDNYSISCNLKTNEDLPIGSYDLVAHIHHTITGEEKEIRLKDAINVITTEATSNIKVDVIASRKASTPYMVNINITNDSDVPCWGIPFNVACERDGGRNGFIFYMRDIFGDSMGLDHIPWYESDNILGTGVDGLYFPLCLSYLHPHETRTLKVGIISEAHKKIGLYAWTGTPYSEEYKSILETPKDSLNSTQLSYSNILDLKTVAYIMTALENDNNYDKPKFISRASSSDNRVLEFMRDHAPDAIGQYEPFEPSSNYADRAAKVAQGIGETQAGLINAGAGMHSFVELENRHIPGATLSEKLQNIEIMYGGFENIGPEASDIKYYYLQGKAELSRAKSPEDIFDDAFDTPEWAKYLRGFIRRNANSSNPMPTRHNIECLMANDPNMISGYSDPYGGPYIGTDISQVYYTVEFENDPELASAAASFVSVDNNLDPNVFDLSTFESISLEIGNRTINLPSEQNFVTTVDLRPEIQCLLEIRQNYSSETGEIKWTFNSLDPLTLEPVENYLQGFLPVNNDKGDGIGIITYSIQLKEGLTNNLTFKNSASIIFDNNAPVVTPEWTNTTDYLPPYAYISKKYDYDGECYAFDVECEDIGSGVGYYDLYIKTPQTNEWTIVMGRQTESHIEFKISEPIPDIKFAVLATDKAGNRQVISALNATTGDADGNGNVDSNDVVLTRNYYTGKTTTINRDNADVTMDGIIDTQDATGIRNIYLDKKSKIIRKRINKRK